MDIEMYNAEDGEDDHPILEISQLEFHTLNPLQHAPPVDPTKQYCTSNSVDALTHFFLTEVLSVVNDAEPAFVASHIKRELSKEYPGDVTRIIIRFLCEKPDYPKIEVRTRKRKHSDGDHTAGPSVRLEQKHEEPKRQKIDWASSDRVPPSEDYKRLANEQLEQDFKNVSRKFIRDAFATKKHLYFPAYFYIKGQTDEPNFHALKGVPTSPSKGKGKRISNATFDAERKAVTDALEAAKSLTRISTIAASNPVLEVAQGGRIECGRCFAKHVSTNMVECPKSHPFCKNCARETAKRAIGRRSAGVRCMDRSGCELEFTDTVLQSFLDNEALGRLERIRTEKTALDEGLEVCPFCDFGGLVENNQERLFRCKRHQCRMVSCLQCRERDHRPKTCEEAMEDRSLGRRHAIEESRKETLTRKCPGSRCSRVLIQRDGCNKIACPTCKTLSCYVCRKVVTGYEHFATGKCPMFDDDLDKRHYDEVTVASRTAGAKRKKRNPDIATVALELDLPTAPLHGLTRHRGYDAGLVPRGNYDPKIDFLDPEWESYIW